MSVWQRCPICDGTGRTFDSFGFRTLLCSTCNGNRIIDSASGKPPSNKKETPSPMSAERTQIEPQGERAQGLRKHEFPAAFAVDVMWARQGLEIAADQIEALRAEVQRLQASDKTWEQVMDQQVAVTKRRLDERDAARQEAREMRERAFKAEIAYSALRQAATRVGCMHLPENYDRDCMECAGCKLGEAIALTDKLLVAHGEGKEKT